MNKFSIFLMALCLIILTSCASQRRAERLMGHNNTLTQTMQNAELSPEQKLDILAGSLADVMNEGVNILNVKKGGKYVKEYFDQNDGNIMAIMSEVAEWQQGLSQAERTTLGLRMLTKPYTKDMVLLIPKFIAKYKAYSTAIRATRRVKDGLLKMGGGLLDGLGNGNFQIGN